MVFWFIYQPNVSLASHFSLRPVNSGAPKKQVYLKN